MATSALFFPVIAAGGIATGAQIAAAFALGAQAVQIGSRFAASQESSAHANFKKAIEQASAEDTKLCMKKLVPVRLLKNKFFQEVQELEPAPDPTDQQTKPRSRYRRRKRAASTAHAARSSGASTSPTNTG